MGPLYGRVAERTNALVLKTSEGKPPWVRIPPLPLMSKKSDRRYDHKRVRAAERQTLHGGHTQLVHGQHWSSPTTLVPNDEETRYPKKRGKKSPPKKERCPVNGRHECLEEEREVTIGYWATLTATRRFKMCVHCGKEWQYVSHGRFLGGWNRKLRKTGWKPVSGR